MNLQESLNYCPECEARLEYDEGRLDCPNCGWSADAEHVMRYEQSHGYAPGQKNG